MIKLNFSHFTVIRFLFFSSLFSLSVFTRTTTCFHSRWNTNRCVILLYDSFRFSFPPAFAALQKVFGFCVFSCSLLSVFVFPLSSGLFWFCFALFSFCYWFAWGMACHAIMMSWFELSFHSPLSTLCCSEFTFIFFVVQKFLERPLSQGAVSVRIFKNKFNVVFITTHTLTHAHGHQ